MGCDYYIDKSLYIYDYQDILLSFINLEENRGYYAYYKDEDDAGYDAYKKEILKPSFDIILMKLLLNYPLNKNMKS